MILQFHRSVFTFIAHFVLLYPVSLILACFAVALVLSFGNFYIEFGNDFRFGYLHSDSPSAEEHAVYRGFFNFSSDPYMMAIIARRTDGGSMLRLDAFEELKAVVERGLSRDINLEDVGSTNILKATLRDFLVYSSETLFLVTEEALKYPDEDVEVGFPLSRLYGQYVTSTRSFYGYDNGHLSMLSYMMLFYADNHNIIPKIKRAEIEWNEELKLRNESLVELRLFGDEIVNEKILEDSFSSIPYFIVGAMLMVVFVFITISHYHQSIPQTLFLTFWTTLCPFMAGSAALGINAYYGTKITCAMFIAPLLVLGVGVDDGFLMMHNWFTSKEFDSFLRLRSMLIATGPSISLTSLTNFCAFLIGGYLSPPALRSFCHCTALAIAFDWLFQMVVFVSALLKFHSFSFTLPHKEHQGRKHIYTRYCEWLRMGPTRFMLIAVLVSYWIWSAYHTLQMHERFSPDKTFDSKSQLAESLTWFDRAFNDHEIFDIFVVDPPENSTLLLEHINKLHSLDYLCHNFTTWVLTYEEEYHPEPGPLQEYFEQLPTFIHKYPHLKFLVHFALNREGSVVIGNFTFDLCVHGYGTWDKRAYVHNDIRKHLPKGFSLYNHDSELFDLILSTRRMLIQSCVVTFFCMVVLCIICIPSFRATSVATIAVISITAGTIGGLGAWGVDMDTVAMINVVMAIGLAVDYAAHISYHYFKEGNSVDGIERMAASVEAIAYATAQAAMTTMLCAAPLYFYPVYMFVTFAKTIFLCTLFGYIHAVIIIPLLLLLFHDSVVDVASS
uniref:SSD domain-containing protein n=1 Tax=Parascaris univalens TaxID=6257 RepID=A0A915BRM1_PARUN